MVERDEPSSVSRAIGETLPFLRRYARALTGSQKSGDRYAETTLEAILRDQSIFNSASSHRVALYSAFHRIWASLGTPVDGVCGEGIEAAALKHLAGLTANTREALLLTTIEGFSTEEAAEIMALQTPEVERLVSVAMKEMTESATGMVMIIEDEPAIAMHLQSIVEDLGHTVTGVARTHAEALDQFHAQTPDMIMSDIQLADMSSGVDAVNDMLREVGDMPVIFITAFPEALLTGERPEPAFLITKPYKEHVVQSAVSQAMFFSSTAALMD